MYCYNVKNQRCISNYFYEDLEAISLDRALESQYIYLLKKMEPSKSRRSFLITDSNQFFTEEEGLNLLLKGTKDDLPPWLENKINMRKVIGINTNYPNWRDNFNIRTSQKWRINLFGLGDVGGTLLIGLRLLGGDRISKIGIYDRKEEKVKRWVYEANQILSPEDILHPPVEGIREEELFDCDMFIFCASVGVPPVGKEAGDVRMTQFQGNSELIGKYARMARDYVFKGIFAVVSDPVDLLCKSVFLQSNINKTGNLDYNGLAPEQIRGYGLGVMHARASFYASQDKNSFQYLKEGRAFGPHGEGLIIADSIKNYNDAISRKLTELTKNANLEIRKTGFKPYIAPALSSGALSIIATIKGEWHYSSVFLGGVFMGCRNKLSPLGTEIERNELPSKLLERIREVYNELEKIL